MRKVEIRTQNREFMKWLEIKLAQFSNFIKEGNWGLEELGDLGKSRKLFFKSGAYSNGPDSAVFKNIVKIWHQNQITRIETIKDHNQNTLQSEIPHCDPFKTNIRTIFVINQTSIHLPFHPLLVVSYKVLDKQM